MKTMDNRRQFLTKMGAGGAALLAPVLHGNFSQGAQKKPNVVLIFADDQGSIDINTYGAKDLITPNLDALAKRGTRFMQFYAAAPVCSPPRAALMTGRYPQRAGLSGNASSSKGHAGMPTEQITIAEMMNGAGYAAGHVGKWHLGYTPETMPNGQGFDDSFGHMGGCIDNYSHFFYWNGPNRHDLWRNGEEVWNDGEFFGDLMVDECKQFITEKKDEPFFLYWAINFPHYPLQGKEKWRKKYEHLEPPRNGYAAFVSTMDEMIGEVVGHLDALGLTEDTIIIFQSDHGHSTEIRTGGGGGDAGPYRGAKFSLFEGGIRVPAIVSWPGHIEENAVREQLATGCDWFPTIQDLCGITPATHKLDGKSLVPVLKSPNEPSQHHVFHWQTGKDSWAVRQGDWKLLGNPQDTSNKAKITDEDKLFLCNLSQDITEMTNLAEQHPDIVKRMVRLHEAWIEDVHKQE
ncbi:MAG: sulfatase-like hydrolase/transferase [Candidatus Hinthialibacter antarcticus]|nr:sulfatase-like hydrolase/transferase [Candidatus Hinthialibacter antarcticus]